MAASPAPSTPPPDIGEKWRIAVENCKKKLPPKELTRVVQTKTYDDLNRSIVGLRKTYQQKTVVRALNRIDPFLRNLHSFNSVINTATQSNPDIAALCWGGIKLILELSIRLKNAIDTITDGMAQVAQMLPRFESYQNLLPSTPQLTQALINVYEAVVGFCFETILALRENPVRNLFRSLWVNYSQSLTQKLEYIQRQSSIVDVESTVAKLIVDNTRHEELKRMIAGNKTDTTAKLPCYSIPFSANAGFFGRNAELGFCTDALNLSEPGTGPKGLALHGNGGIGKTSVALQLAYQEKAQRKVIIWIAADDIRKIFQGFVEAAAKLGLHRPNADAKADRDSVKDFLEKTTEAWLIVFDNAENPDDLREFIPQAGNGSYLITSRNPECQYRLSVDGYKIPSFDLSDGRDFLLSLIPHATRDDPRVKMAAESLSEYLGGLALGLKQMGGFIRESGCDIEDLLTSLQDKEQEKQLFEDKGANQNLANAWKVSLSALDSTTMNLLISFSFMDPDCVDDHIMKLLRTSCNQYPKLFPAATTNIRFLQSLRTLTRYGLIEKLDKDNSFAIHRLVQATTLHSTTEKNRADIFNAIIDMFARSHPQSHQTTDTLFHHWEICAHYASHVLQLRMLLVDWKLQPASPEDFWILFFNSSRYLLETGSMAKALILIDTTEQFCDTATSAGEIQLSYLLNGRGLIALQHQQQGEAGALFERALEMRLRILGDKDVRTVSVQGNIALTLINERRWEDLIQFNESRLAVVETNPNIPVGYKSSLYDLLSQAYMEVGALDKAWDAVETATSLVKDAIPVYSQLNGYVHHNRGNILNRLGRTDDALREHLTAFEIRKNVLGNHIQTAASCYRSAVLMAMTGKYDDALTLLHESKKMYGRLGLIGNFARGGEARSSWRVGQVLKDQGKIDEANKNDQDARDTLRGLGKECPAELQEDNFNILLNYVDS